MRFLGQIFNNCFLLEIFILYKSKMIETMTYNIYIFQISTERIGSTLYEKVHCAAKRNPFMTM